jgi:hypothetical protein
MSEHRSDDLTPEEARAFRLLSESRGPSDRSEDRIIEELRQRGLIRPRRVPFARLAQGLALAASLAVAFLLGAQYGRTREVDRAPVAQPDAAVESVSGGALATGTALEPDRDLFAEALRCEDPEYLYDPRCFAVKTEGW